ncbi:PH domain-containing protein [bacterium]|nr:PH domain-containing protein [bacterium]
MAGKKLSFPEFSVVLCLIAAIFLSPAFSIIAEYDSGSLLPLTCISLFLLLILSYPLLKKVLTLLYTTYTLTTKKIIIESGIVGRSHKTIPVQKIQDVGYKQTILERFFGIGDVIVESAGEQGAIHLLDLPSCQQRTQQILRLVEKMAS